MTMKKDEVIKRLKEITCFRCKDYNTEYMDCNADKECDFVIRTAIRYLEDDEWNDFSNGETLVPISEREVLVECIDCDGKSFFDVMKYNVTKRVFTRGMLIYQIISNQFNTFLPVVKRWKYIR